MNRFHRWYCRTDRWTQAVQNELLPWVLEGVELGPDALEIGPGPGRATEELRRHTARLTSLEIDPCLAASLRERLAGTNVTIVEGDGKTMPFEPATFSSAVCLTMLHHVPSEGLQDQLLAEVHRVLKPGGILVGSDSRWSPVFQMIHLFDTMVIVDPETFGRRLESAGFVDVEVQMVARAFRFRARRAARRDGQAHRFQGTGLPTAYVYQQEP